MKLIDTTPKLYSKGKAIIADKSKWEINKWREILNNKRNGKERLSSYLASLSLGRGFGQDSDEYIASLGRTDFVYWARDRINGIDEDVPGETKIESDISKKGDQEITPKLYMRHENGKNRYYTKTL